MSMINKVILAMIGSESDSSDVMMTSVTGIMTYVSIWTPPNSPGHGRLQIL